MKSNLRVTVLVALFSIALSPASFAAPAAALPDADGDGICDAHEESLGTDPRHPETLRTIVNVAPLAEAARQRKGYDATKDFTKVEFCHVGGDRYLWRVTFAAPPRLEDTVLHLYVDADADAATGRKGPPGAATTGTDYMLSVVGDRGTSSAFSADGRQQPGPAVRYVVAGNSVLMSADVKLARDAQGARYGLYVLCHTTTAAKQSPSMSKSSRKVTVAGIPLSDRPKIVRPGDHLENFRVQATFGDDLLNAVAVDKNTLVVPHDKLHLQGFEVDLFTSNRWPHVKLTKRDGRVWTEAPRAGRFHVGFMMYDDSNDERLGFFIDGKFMGAAVARQDNNRTWLYWLAEPYAFRGRERVELRPLGGQGRFGIVNMLFLPEAPEIRTVRYAVENLVSATHVGRPGRVTVSWTTTWPCPTRFEYGRDAKYGKTSTAEGNCLVHRVVLDGLDPKVEYHGRAVGTARDGSPFASPDFAFRASPPSAPTTPEGVKTVPLAVRNPHPFAVRQWPISTGVPFPQGALGSADCVRLLRGDSEEPAQVQLTARWPDGSVKWLLITFLADAPPAGQAEYRLDFGRDVRPAKAAAGLKVSEDRTGAWIDTGALHLLVDVRGDMIRLRRASQPDIDAQTICTTTAEDARGTKYHLLTGEFRVEESGPIRAVLKAVAPLVDAKGKLLSIEQRIEVYRGSPLVQFRHTLVADGADKFTEIRRLTYNVSACGAARPWQASLADGKSLALDGSLASLVQRFDCELVVGAANGQTQQKGRLVGGLVSAGDQGCAVAVRDFWQNYPKGFRLAQEGIEVDLCPRFEAGIYDKFPFEREGHHLYYYLLDGKYRLKQGVSKTHEMLLCFAPPAEREHYCALFQQPLLATAPAEWYCRSRAFYDVAPRNVSRFKLYEEAIDKNLKGYAAACERQHDFGLMNYGDWYGERGTNWGNEEYDTQHAFFLEYVRSGNPQAFFLGAATELHNRDIDTVQASPNPDQLGAVYIHQMCHVGDYYDKSVPGALGFAHGGFSVSHAWTEGHFDHYFLTGDRRSYETGCRVADYFVRHELGRPYDFLSCRVPGWHLIMLASAYHATGDPYYLNAARVVVDRVLETQDKQPRPLPEYQAAGRRPFQVGGWSRMMVPGHCLCEPRHRGNAGFMVAVLLSGLKYYHDVVGDPRVKECIIRGAHYLVEECYSDETRGFRYTSCPNTKYGRGASPLMVEGIARAYLWTKDERFRRVLTEALPLDARGSAYGKGFSMYYRMGPRVLADLEAAGLRLDEPPAK